MTQVPSLPRKLTLPLVAALVLFGAGSVGIAQATVYGINYDVVGTDTSQTPNCKTGGNVTVRGKFVTSRYGDAKMQEAVRAELKPLRESGFQSVRSIFELFPGSNPSGDLIDTGKVDESLLGSVRDYVRDMRDAGFKELILAFGMQGPASPICRKAQWGDCFDASTIESSVEAESKIVQAAHSVKGVSLRVDLLNEGCVSAAGPKSANENFTRFIHAAAKMHATHFADVPATVSCQIERTGDGLASTERLFGESGSHVGFFDIHAYPVAAHIEATVLVAAAKSLGGSKTPVIIGETTYGDPEYRHWITDSYRQAFGRDPSELLFWPLHSMSSHCNFDVAHPYRLKDALATP